MSRTNTQSQHLGRSSKLRQILLLILKLVIGALVVVPAFVDISPSRIYTLSPPLCTTCPLPAWIRETTFSTFDTIKLFQQASSRPFISFTGKQVFSDSVFRGGLSVRIEDFIEVGHDSISATYKATRSNPNNLQPGSLQPPSCQYVQDLRINVRSLDTMDIKATEHITIISKGNVPIREFAFSTTNLNIIRARLTKATLGGSVGRLSISDSYLEHCNLYFPQKVWSLIIENTQLDSTKFDFNVSSLSINNVDLQSYARIKIPSVCEVKHLTGDGILELKLSDSAYNTKENFKEANRENTRLPRNYNLFKSVVVISDTSFFRIKFDPQDIVLRVDPSLSYDTRMALHQVLINYFKGYASAKKYYDIEYQKDRDENKSKAAKYVNETWTDYGYFGFQTWTAIYQVFATIFTFNLLFLFFTIPPAGNGPLQNARITYQTALVSPFWIRLRYEIWLSIILTLIPILAGKPKFSELDLTKISRVVWYYISSAIWALLVALAIRAGVAYLGL